MTFKEKLFKHAWDLAGKKAQFESEASVYRNVGIECGEWAREETIEEILNLLPSDAAWDLSLKLASNVHQEFTKGAENER